ncbi:hypothetical protein ISX56_34795, partial [Serratia ureilytica]|nr:hypothetical protein [Serratia ureilytica]
MTLAALALLCSQAQAETLQTGKDVEAPTAKWEGVALGFEPPQPGLLGDMLGAGDVPDRQRPQRD